MWACETLPTDGTGVASTVDTTANNRVREMKYILLERIGKGKRQNDKLLWWRWVGGDCWDQLRNCGANIGVLKGMSQDRWCHVAQSGNVSTAGEKRRNIWNVSNRVNYFRLFISSTLAYLRFTNLITGFTNEFRSLVTVSTRRGAG